MRAGVKVSQMTQISSLLFHVHRLHGFTQILSYSGLRAPGISEPRCKDTKTVRGQFTVAHTCSWLLILSHRFFCSGVSKPFYMSCLVSLLNASLV